MCVLGFSFYIFLLYIQRHNQHWILEYYTAMEKPTPLINSAMLAEHAGQTVKVVGKLQRVSRDLLILMEA